tara:strand:+ start:14139 stop:15071 length:933 start_codon:yes stop_codon:yes gene_type:complete
MEKHKIDKTNKLIWYRGLIDSARPKQWIKNLIVYFALFFTVGESWQLSNTEELARLLLRSTAVFAIFCLITSSIYVVNDILDKDKDRHHLKKKARPIAAEQIDIKLALGFAGILAVVGAISSYVLSPNSFLMVVGYFLLMILYSVCLKQIVIVDVITISLGFVIRAVTGAIVIDVSVSPWLYVCTGLAALFLGFSKRLNEKKSVGSDGYLQRETLQEYSVDFLQQLIAISATSSLLAYTLYTFTSPNLPSNNAMMLTIPFVVYGLLRYLFLVNDSNQGESPEELILKDLPFKMSVVAWLLVGFTILIYYR